ncbi:PaaI family thioesterase [Egicoccus halophilus]|uniref:PaaI family thioesterase n=1 Tax=Egicoccus halophilus TaxID=1670830 RepID=UPI00103053C8|nr:PaaI family thioesterase [Egicoccus halophilus]
MTETDADVRARAAAALRRLSHALIAHEADEDLLERVATTADRVAADLEGQPPRQRDLLELKRRMFDIDVPDGGRVVHFDECFVSGPWNPMGIAIEVHREADEAVAEVSLGAAFEGAPGRSHGGIVAAIFDDVLGYLLTLRQEPGFTGQLTVRYLAATPIGQPLRFRARVEAVEGRKRRTVAEARVLGADGTEGEVVATAEATFVVIDLSRFRT